MASRAGESTVSVRVILDRANLFMTAGPDERSRNALVSSHE